MSLESLDCPYCGDYAILADAKVVYGQGRNYGKLWICRNYPVCDTFVGCHKGTDTPKGTLANKELREWRIRAHEKFDITWKFGGMKRGEAYKLLMEKINVEGSEVHIGSMNIEQCKKVVEIFGRM